MLLKRIIVFLFILTFGGSILFFIFWDLPAPNKKIERNIDINSGAKLPELNYAQSKISYRSDRGPTLRPLYKGARVEISLRQSSTQGWKFRKFPISAVSYFSRILTIFCFLIFQHSMVFVS